MYYFEKIKIEKEPKAELIFRLKFSFQDQNSLEKARRQLKKIINKEATDQLIFVLSVMKQDSWRNQCDKAVKTLGMNLTEHWGGEESFFDLMPENVNFVEARAIWTKGKLKNKFKDSKHHSIAVLEFPKKKENYYLIIDLVHGHISIRDEEENILLLCYKGNKEAVFNKLNEYFGGKWEIATILNKEKKNFKYNLNDNRY